MLIMLLLHLLVSLLFVYQVDLKQNKVKDYCSRNCTKIKPVCGTDENDYQSYCHLKKSNCLSKRHITVEHTGKCDSCPVICSKKYKPICATDDVVEKTFLNLCQFKKEMCDSKNKNRRLKVKKKGPCKPWMKKTCPEACGDIWAPVCASNGKTYSSICAVKLVGCTMTHADKQLKLKKVGYCKKDLCPDSCPENYKPTCGSNGVLYVNECELFLNACKLKKMKQLKKVPLKKCRNKCVKQCPLTGNEVCGSDLNVYLNECELQKKNCQEKKKLHTLDMEYCGTMGSKDTNIEVNSTGPV